ncbi:TPA: abortive infection system antitoxin AbiGi family protein [Vibrio cholerae]
MKPRSDNLFHFTKSIDILESILKNGFYARYCLEDIRWLNSNEDKFIAFPMVCFCDIPLSRATEHTEFYGSYGLGLTKDWGIRNNLNPVVYGTDNGLVRDAIHYFAELSRENKHGAVLHGMNLVQLSKPLAGEMQIGERVIEKDFFQENEWRYISLNSDQEEVLRHCDFLEKREQFNEKAKVHNLKFIPSDIKYIFVPTDNEIPRIVDHLYQVFGDCSHNHLKILQSRVISIETLNRDI